MLSIPPSAITSASPSFWQVMPFAPAAIWSRASIGLLWVLICGRLATSAASQAAWMRAMLRSTRSMSMTATGVPYSRAIFAARGVVIELTPVVPPRHCERKRSNPWLSGVEWIASSQVLLAMTLRIAGVSCLLYFFTQHFKIQPLVLGVSQFLLRRRQRIRGGVESLAVLLVEIGIVQNSLLLCDLGLQFRNRLRQRFQRVFFVEIQ